MRKFLGTFATVFAIFFFAPTGLILASWNAIPGDTLYPTKRAFESVALAITVKTPIGSALSLNFTDRRFKEADKLLTTKGSTLGYSLLVESAQQTQQLISDQKDSKKAADFIASIDEYQKSIDAKSVALQTQAAAPVYQQPIQTTPTYQQPTTTQTPPQMQTQQTVVQQATPSIAPVQNQQVPATQVPSAPVALVQQSQNTAQTIAQLNQAKENLEKIKEEVKKDLPPQASDRANEVHDKIEERKDNKDNEKQK